MAASRRIAGRTPVQKRSLTIVRTAPEDVLTFWFADALACREKLSAASARWFDRSEAFDETIRSRFGALPGQAARGELNEWRNEPRSALALIIVLDQFPRNLFRGQPEAFSLDPLAREAALAAIERRFDEMLHPVEASFLYLPLEHAEDLALQDRCVALFDQLVARADAGCREQLERFAGFARSHQDVIRRFGRFPHRNEIVNRPSTDEESAYLAGGGHRF